MAKVQKTVITALGEQMLFSSALTYTNATLCSQDISNLTIDQLRSLTDLTGKVLSSPISAHKRQGNTKADQVDVQVTFTNQDQKADINYSSIGWFARDRQGHETLIAVTPFVGTDTIAAAPPDGAATSSKNITLSMAAGTATEINVLIDPAGSVTPSTFNAEVDKINEALALKADNAELADYAKKADVNSALDAKADKSTVDSDVKSINDTLATKADKQTVTDDLVKKADKTDVDAQIGTVNKSVSDLSDTVKANKDDADKTLATKADKATVESDLATKANQSDLDKTNSEVAKKADSEDVNAQLATKANSKDVNAALALKDDTADVDDKISNVAKSVSDLSATVTANKKATDSTLATKANASDVADSLATKADKTDVASDVKSLNDAINTKASQADLDQTNAVVATKANATALADYARTVDVDADLDTKANKTDLESLAKTADVNSALDTKADKTTVDGDVKTLQASIDTKADKTALDDYAKSADVASDVKTLTDSIAAKADAKTVNDAISKIDFTPYAKSADVDSKLQGYTNTADLTKLLDVKANAVDVYSKTELDKKLLDLSTDTDGKVNADQVSSMIANKVDKSDLASDLKSINDSIATKANTTDVNTALAKKDDTTDVDAKIKTVIDLANTKADASDIYNKKAVDDAFSSRDATIATKADKTYVDNQIASIDFGKIKFRKQYVNSDGQTADKTWSATKNQDGTYTIDLWQDDWTASKLYGVLAQLPNKADTSTVNAQIADAKNTIKSSVDNLHNDLQNQINAKLNKTDTVNVVNSYDVNNNQNGGANKWPVTQAWYVDQTALRPFADQINQLKGRRQVDTPDFNNLTDTGTYYVSNPGANTPTGSWGNLLVSNGDGHRTSQLYFPDDGSAPFSRELDESAWHGWIQLSTTAQTGNAQTTANQAKDLATQANNGLAGKADKSQVNVATTLYRMIGDSDTWQKIFGVDNSDTAVLTSLRLQGGTGPLLGNFAAGVGFGGADTKGVLQVAYSDHQARITGGNGSTPVWSEDIAWKSDISSLTQALTKLQAAFDAQQTKIAALQATVNNQANQLTYFKQHYIEGKAFDADQIKQAMAWTDDDGQKLAIIRDKENEGGK